MENYYYNILLVFTVLILCIPDSGMAQTNCTILKSNCPPSDLVPTCATTVVNGVAGAYVSWSPPSFSLSCPGGTSGYDFVMSYNLNEHQSGVECWLYNHVQRVASGGGRLNLWQSTGSGNPSFTTPTFYLPLTPTNCSMTITNGSHNDFTVKVYLIFSNGTMSGVNTSFLVSGSKEYSFAITPLLAGAYRLFFEFTGDGDHKDFVDLLQINASLVGSGCTDDINFSLTSDHTPGDFFPVGTTKVSYTAICNSCVPIISETCQFDVVVTGVTASATITNATCGLNNGTASITAVSTNSSPAFQYNLDNSGWTNFTSPATITGLAPGNHLINVRDYFPNIPAYCQILSPLSINIANIIDIINPVVSCPANISINGCDLNAVVSTTGLSYSTTLQTITLQQFSATGATATDNCGVVSWQYRDISSGTCPIIVTRTFTVSDARGNSASCNQTLTISDSQAPSLTIFGSTDYCVEDLDFSVVNAPRTDITSRPDWYNLQRGSTELDISNYSDNCTSKTDLTIRWRFDFADGTSLSGNGQISAYGSDIHLPGMENQTVIHHLTYWVKDKCGNETGATSSLTIHPRPQINKQT